MNSQNIEQILNASPLSMIINSKSQNKQNQQGLTSLLSVLQPSPCKSALEKRPFTVDWSSEDQNCIKKRNIQGPQFDVNATNKSLIGSLQQPSQQENTHKNDSLFDIACQLASGENKETNKGITLAKNENNNELFGKLQQRLSELLNQQQQILLQQQKSQLSSNSHPTTSPLRQLLTQNTEKNHNDQTILSDNKKCQKKNKQKKNVIYEKNQNMIKNKNKKTIHTTIMNEKLLQNLLNQNNSTCNINNIQYNNNNNNNNNPSFPQQLLSPNSMAQQLFQQQTLTSTNLHYAEDKIVSGLKIENILEVDDINSSSHQQDAATKFQHPQAEDAVSQKSTENSTMSSVENNCHQHDTDNINSPSLLSRKNSFEPIEEPPLASITKLFPDWDLVQIAEFAHNGKRPLQKEERNTRASKNAQKAEQKQKDKERATRASAANAKEQQDDNDFYSEEEINHMLSQMVEKLKKPLGFDDIDMEKLFKTLDKHGMNVKRSVSLIKKNLPFYRNYFKAPQE